MGVGGVSEHVCDSSCAHTIDVGYVHIQTGTGMCIASCPHPDHKSCDWYAVDRDTVIWCSEKGVHGHNGNPSKAQS